MKYQVEIKHNGEVEEIDFFNTKTEVVRFIAKTFGVSQRSISKEISPRCNDWVHRDTIGYRAKIWYDDGAY